MELLLTVTATDGRLTGTARRPGRDAASDSVVAFSGSLELLACLERLVCGEDADRPRTHPWTMEGH
jgi:hypothetical protein